MNNKNPKVDIFLSKVKKWNEELEKLRMIVLDCGLLFFKGILLNDTNGILIQQTENVQSGRQIRFTILQEIVKMEPILKNYIYETIEIEKAGLEVNFKKTTEFKILEEFQRKLDKNSDLKNVFETLTLGRQRAYILHFSAPKQSKTRESRIEKYT